MHTASVQGRALTGASGHDGEWCCDALCFLQAARRRRGERKVSFAFRSPASARPKRQTRRAHGDSASAPMSSMHSVPPASLMVRLQQQQQQQWRQAAAPTSHSSVARRRARRAPDGSVEAPTDHGEWAQSTRDFAAAWWPMEQLRCGSSGSTCSRRSVAMARAVYRVPSVPGRARSGAWPRGDLWDPWGARRDAQRSTRRRPRNSVGAELHVRVGCMSKLHRTLHTLQLCDHMPSVLSHPDNLPA